MSYCLTVMAKYDFPTVIIGFLKVNHIVNEGDGHVEVCVQIMSGDVPHRGLIAIRFSTLGISATCKLDIRVLLACEVTSVFH